MTLGSAGTGAGDDDDAGGAAAGVVGGAAASGAAGASVDAALGVHVDGGSTFVDTMPLRASDCPASPASASGACRPGLVCEYRDPGVLPSCLTRLRCDVVNGQGTWQTGGSCAANSPSCPATYATLAEGAYCLPNNDPACDYDEGRCSCSPCGFGSGPDSQGRWTCRSWDGGGPGCPPVSPLAGTACATAGQLCAYGRPCNTLAVGDNYECVAGLWQPYSFSSPPGSCPTGALCPAALTCSFSTAPTAPAAASPDDAFETRAHAAALVKYDAIVGRFLRGNVRVYKGQLGAAAVTNVSGSNPPRTTVTGFREGPAIALLDVRPKRAEDWNSAVVSVPAGGQTAVMVVHALQTRQYVVFGQEIESPDVTWSGFVTSDDPAVGVSSNRLSVFCRGCVVPFASRPNNLSFDKFVAVEAPPVAPDGGIAANPEFIHVSGNLGILTPCMVTWTDLQTLDTVVGPSEGSEEIGLRYFKTEGDERVLHDAGVFIDWILPQGTCATRTYYSIDLWVKTADLAVRGTRNFKVTETSMFCAP
jgi:hypothetical protein